MRVCLLRAVSLSLLSLLDDWSQGIDKLIGANYD